MSETSPEYTVTIGSGVADVLQACLRRLGDTAGSELQADSYQQLVRLREESIAQIMSFVGAFVGSLLHSNQHDGNVHLFVDGPESIFFRYDSGYHGAMILHQPGGDPRKASWSVHT